MFSFFLYRSPVPSVLCRRCYAKLRVAKPKPYNLTNPAQKAHPEIYGRESNSGPDIQKKPSRSTETRAPEPSSDSSNAHPPPPPPPPPPPRGPLQRALHASLFILPVIPIAFLFTEHVGQITRVNGPSMTPYLNENYATMHSSKDVIVVNRVNAAKNLKRGMVVTFR